MESESVTQGPRRSGRSRHEPKRYGFLITDDKRIVLVDHNEPCVYKKVSGSGIVFLLMYVDDILIIGNNIPTLQSVKTWLENVSQ